ncbi:LysR substrate-binding domain-containing protein [Burkholderia lata]|uniref:LysR family transcriptional regulator n=1 Tax=Burkholderia lata (strain ATCC 17760 / DSM 23089 / LMG 22485 / NCIMB 9086 / R18194 / 383) TaxID=482957 RepID=A0A6P3C6F7_BURL3|nr:LysR substrate-binding domain-containing protein [Burkholderia lata]VWB89204.1 LysR family transcriptional regulator [Burkholderia lata]VWM07682.1 LysR family transcriptional regulator [Burkholderia lata]
MSQISLDIEVLRSFATGVELGSFAQAAERLNRSASAVSAQLKKLEEQAGQPLLYKTGRNLALTPAGEVLLGYARRLLDLNDEAVHAMRGDRLEGQVRFGMPEDFGETLLPAILARFAQTYPKVHVEIKVSRSQQLLNSLGEGKLDVALAWDNGQTWLHGQMVGTLPLCWIDSDASPNRWSGGSPVPLATLESPCLMREQACMALDHAGLAWRQAFTSSSLGGIWAAVTAGLGVTIRTPVDIPRHLTVRHDLPPLPEIQLMLYQATAKPHDSTQRLMDIVGHTIRQHLRRYGVGKYAG